MNFRSYDPPLNPSRADCRDALAKGLGREALWAESGRLHLAELQRACVHDLRLDKQCEVNRADWLWMLIERSGNIGPFETIVWEAMQSQDDTGQMYQLAMRYALLGRERFTSRLFELVREQPLGDDDRYGEFELIVVAGMEGFLVVARKRGQRLHHSDWDYYDDCFILDATEILGESTVQSAIGHSDDDDIRRFFQQWEMRQNATVNAESQSYADRHISKSVEEVLAAAKTDDRCFWFRRWGISADASDIKRIFQHLVHSGNADEQCRLLRVFMRRELPDVHPVLFEFARSGHEELAFAAGRALERTPHPDIRDFGLDRLRRGDLTHAAELLTKNYQPGDELMILESIKLPDDAGKLHGLLMACCSLLEANQEADADPLAQLIYREQPCSLCRTHAVRALKRQGKVPSWMLDEVRLDCDDTTRQLFYPQPDQLSSIVITRMAQLRCADRESSRTAGL